MGRDVLCGSTLVASALFACSLFLACGSEPSPRSAVLIVLDTLRADRLGIYGHDRASSPRIDEFASESIVFDNAISFGAWTLPSTTALMTGRYPTKQEFNGTLAKSLVENLRDGGFATAGFTEGGYVSHHFGFDRGFQVYQDHDSAIHVGGESDEPEVAVRRTFSDAQAWLRRHATEPFFLLVHTYEVHIPYIRTHFAKNLPRGELAPKLNIAENTRIRSGRVELSGTEKAYLGALYDGGVRVADEEVGKLVALLDELGIADDTLVVLTSDHGEDLGDRYPHYAAEHGHSLYDELIRVPLIIRETAENRRGRRITQTVRSVDVMPTILDRLGVVPPEGDGRSLVALMRGEENESRHALSHNLRFGPERVSLRSDGYKLIMNVSPDESRPPVDPNAAPVEFFDLNADPGERNNIAERRPPALPQLHAELVKQFERSRTLGPANFGPPPESPELEQQLRELGYVR